MRIQGPSAPKRRRTRASNHGNAEVYVEAPRGASRKPSCSPGKHEPEAATDVPGENGRVYRCRRCKAYLFRRMRFGGAGKLVGYECSVNGCKNPAFVRLQGRGPRGAYRWSCGGH